MQWVQRRPMYGGNATQKDYINPRATVYVTEGNGGVPPAPCTHKFSKPSADWARIHGTGGAYGIIRLTNSTVLSYDHVWNNGNNGTGEVMETWSIVQHNHTFSALPHPWA